MNIRHKKTLIIAGICASSLNIYLHFSTLSTLRKAFRSVAMREYDKRHCKIGVREVQNDWEIAFEWRSHDSTQQNPRQPTRDDLFARRRFCVYVGGIGSRALKRKPPPQYITHIVPFSNFSFVFVPTTYTLIQNFIHFI